MIKFFECVPDKPVIRSSNYYDNDWLYVYRISDNECISRMITKAYEMANHSGDYRYVNPSFGKNEWCCVTVISYWVCIGKNVVWVFGDSTQPYLWSPRYGGNYDGFMINYGFEKIPFYRIGKEGLKAGDILQSWSHAVLCYDDNRRFELSEMPILKIGSFGNVVKNLQILLNYWMCQNGTNKPLLVDGVLGTLTEQRLKDYQKIQRLTVDGICGYETWKDILLS